MIRTPRTEAITREMMIEGFRREVQDKLAVAYHHGTNTRGIPRGNVLDQCEDFIVELFVAALSAPPQEELRPYARLLELMDEYGLKDCDDLKHTLEDHQRWEAEIKNPAPPQEPGAGWQSIETGRRMASR